ncbi:Fur family transcriptional regulator [Pontibacter chitinilyticus]|uniref:Fur family transcriptional regulator n=1 Tax=Pontibacter chitinilyticus TaxID=2674989 RepID=UPI00321BB802
MNHVQTILHTYGLRKTGCRQDVLGLFLANPFALAHADLERLLGERYDRVTLYRTLYAFEEQGLLHSINDVSGAVKYALCQEACSPHQHHDNHIHFNCTSCGQTFCLNDVAIPPLPLPEGYQVNSLHFSAQGICKACAQHA